MRCINLGIFLPAWGQILIPRSVDIPNRVWFRFHTILRKMKLNSRCAQMAKPRINPSKYFQLLIKAPLKIKGEFGLELERIPDIRVFAKPAK
jgi:hypothetical protein